VLPQIEEDRTAESNDEDEEVTKEDEINEEVY
jgi:hypothetical protein